MSEFNGDDAQVTGSDQAPQPAGHGGPAHHAHLKHLQSKRKSHTLDTKISFCFPTNKLKNYLRGAARLSILRVVCEVASLQTEGQAVLSEVAPHALAALGHHP